MSCPVFLQISSVIFAIGVIFALLLAYLKGSFSSNEKNKCSNLKKLNLAALIFSSIGWVITAFYLIQATK